MPIDFTHKDLQDLVHTVIQPLIKKHTDELPIALHLFGIVQNVTDKGNKADVKILYGQDEPIITGISNKSGVILQINDEVMITAPNGDLTSCYIDKNKNPTPLFDGAKIRGILTVGGIDNTNGEIDIKSLTEDSISIIIHDTNIDFYDWLKTGLKVGAISTTRTVNENGDFVDPASVNISSEKGTSTIISTKNDDNTMHTVFEVSNNAYSDGITAYMHNPFYISDKVNIDVDSHHAFYCQPDADGGNKLYGNTNFEGYDMTDIGTANMTNLQVSGSKNCVQDTKDFGKKLFNSYELPEHYLGDLGFGIIKNGQCIVYLDEEVQESINLERAYHIFIQFYEDCHFKIEKCDNYFIVTADKDIEFSWEVKAKRRGFENYRLEDADHISREMEKPIGRSLADMITSKDLYAFNPDMMVDYMLQDMFNSEDNLVDYMLE